MVVVSQSKTLHSRYRSSDQAHVDLTPLFDSAAALFGPSVRPASFTVPVLAGFGSPARLFLMD
jgi:hypothetical protein